jgi:hypothetical protein
LVARKERRDVKVIFITGLGHSGSTLVMSVGELKQLGRFARFETSRKRHPCTCGARTLWACPLWSRVSTLTKAASGQKIDQLNVENYGAVETFNRDNVVLFNAIAKASGKTYIVDSSKDHDRLRLLIANPTLDVFPIFVQRDPKGQISSYLRKKQGNLLKLIYRYVTSSRDIYDLVKRAPHAIVHYEQLVREPELTLSSLMHQLGLEYDPRQLDWAKQVRHNIGGNRMRRATESELRLDESWRHKLTLAQKLAIDAATIPARYPFIKLGLHSLIRS